MRVLLPSQILILELVLWLGLLLVRIGLRVLTPLYVLPLASLLVGITAKEMDWGF